VLRALVDDNHPVEYGQPLFDIEEQAQDNAQPDSGQQEAGK
jgi:hypothetical protein